MTDLEPIELEIALKGLEALQQSDQLDKSLKGLDVSVEKLKKKFQEQTQILNRHTQTQKEQTQTTKAQTQATKEQNEVLQKTAQQATASAGKFNALGNSVNQITRELPAFTYSAQTGFMAVSNNIPILVDAMARLRAENEQLRASGQKTTSVWKQLIGSVFSWGTALSLGITLMTIYGKEIGNFITSLFKGKQSFDEAKASFQALNEAFDSEPVRRSVKDILSLEQSVSLVKKGVIQKKEALSVFNNTLGDSVGKLESFDQMEQWLDQNKDRYVKMMLYKATANKIMEKATDELIKKEQTSMQTAEQSANFWDKVLSSMANSASSGTAGLPSTYKGSDLKGYSEDVKKFGAERRKTALEEHQKEIDQHKSLSEKFLKMAQEEAEKMGISIIEPEKVKDRSKQTENEYQKLLEKIAELDKEYNVKSFDKHNAEIQALKDKFEKVRKLVEEFNKNPNNKVKIGLSDLNSLEEKALKTLQYRQETETLKKEISQQKEIFSEYEKYKTKVGEKEAQARFKNDLKGVSTYLQYLENLQEKTKNQKESPEQTERLREIQAQILLAQEEQEKHQQNKFADLLEAYKGFNQKRLDIESQYNEDIFLLEKQRNEANADAVNEAINLRKAKYEEDLNNLQATILQSSDFYQKLFSDLSQKGYKTLKGFAQYTSEVLQSAKTYNTTDGKTMVRIEFDQINQQGEIVKRVSNITIAEFERIKAKADELNKVLREKNPFAGVVSSFKEVIASAKEGNTDEMVASLSGLDSSVKNSIGTLKAWGDSLSVVFGDGVSNAMDDIAKLAGGVFDLGSGIARIAAGDIVGGITSSLSGISAIYKQVTGWREKAREQQIKMQIADMEALRLIHKQNLALKENVRELSVYNDNLELRNRLIKEGVIAQDGVQNKFKYDFQLLKDYQTSLQKEMTSKNSLWEKVGNSWFDTGKISTGSASYRQFSAMIGQDFESAKRRMLKASQAIGNEATEAYNMLNEAGSMENWVKMLHQRGWLHGEAKAFYEQWEKSGQSVTELQNKLADLKNEMRQIVMGENFDGFVNNFANALAQSQGNITQFADFTEKKIKASLFNAFKYQYLREQLKPLYEQMSDMLNEGVDTLDTAKIEAISQQFESIYKNANTHLEKIGKNLGTNLYEEETSDKTSQNSLKGAVKGITAEQADLLAGQFGGLRLTQLETNKINQTGFSNLFAETSKMVGIQTQIEKNTRQTADNTSAMKEHLKNIEIAVKSNNNHLKGNGIKP